MRRLLHAGIAFTMLGLAPSCGRSMANPEVPGWVQRPSYALQLIYRRNLVGSSREAGEAYERGQPAIDPDQRRVFVGSSDWGLYALRAEDGQTLWRFETLGPVQSEPFYDASEDVVYFGSNDGALYKVAAHDGELLWRFSSNAEVARQAIVSDDAVYFVNANDTVVCVDQATGKRRWSQHRSPALGMEVAGHAGLMIDDGKVYVAFSDGTVAAYDKKTGSERWAPVDLSAEAEQSLGEVPKYLDVDTTPIRFELGGVPAVAVGSYDGGVFALDAETGNVLWSNPGVLGVSDVNLWQQPAHVGSAGERYPKRSVLIASTGTTGLWGLDSESGAELWRRDLPDGGTSKPAFMAGAMLISTTRQGLYLLSPIDGAIIDGIHADPGFSMPPVAHGQRAFVLANSGDFLAFSLAAPKRRSSARSVF